MTHKDYVLIAAAIRRVSDAPEANALTVRAIVQSLASALADDNERFKSNTFNVHCTGMIDLSGKDYVERVGVERVGAE
jgi:hypothetical protein